jgi:adhesin/invasin
MLACGGEDLILPTDETPSSRLPTSLQIAAGNGQIGTAGAALAQALAVRVEDQDGAGLPGQTVSWIVTTGQGNATPSSVTDEQGYASAAWTLGNPGPNTLTATVAGLGSVTFTATANNSGGGNGGGGNGGGGGGGGGNGGGGGTGSVPSAVTSTLSADPATIVAGAGSSTIRVTVRDAAGARVPGVVVTLSATGSGNSLIQPAGPTGSDGVAIGTLRSTVAGTKDVTATVNGTVQLEQTAQVFVEAAPASRIEMVDGNGQRAEEGSQVAVPPAVRVTNSAGEPVANVAVTFVVTRGGGSVSGAVQTTNAQGIARVGSWTLGDEGRNTLEARAGSLNGSPVEFTATATSSQPPPMAEPDHFEFRVQPHDVREGEWFRIEVAIMDASGRVVPLDGTQVYVGLWREGEDHPSNQWLAGDRFVYTVNGIAVFDLYVHDEGTYRFKARSDYLPKHLGPYGPELFSDAFTVD